MIKDVSAYLRSVFEADEDCIMRIKVFEKKKFKQLYKNLCSFEDKND
jgi:hypothetical protein